MRKFRQKSTDEKLAIQYFKEKSQWESLNAGSAGTGGELDMGERRKSESKDSYKGKAASRSMPIFRKKSTDENKSVSYVVDKLHRKSDDVVGRRRESEFTTSERRGSEGKKSTNKGRKDSWTSDKSRRKSPDTGSVQSGSELDGSERRGSVQSGREIDGSERRGSVGSENYKTERKMNRFQKWRRRLSGAKREGNKKKEIKIKRTPALKSLKEPPNMTDSLQALQENITSENETNREQVTGIEQENLTA